VTRNAASPDLYAWPGVWFSGLRRRSRSAFPASRYHGWVEARRTQRRRDRTLDRVNTAAVLADAMTDYVLTVGVGRAAPAAGAPEHMAAWLEAHGYHVVHHPQLGRPNGCRRHPRPRPPDHCHGPATIRTSEGGAR
jgi:hypothetical protein